MAVHELYNAELKNQYIADDTTNRSTQILLPLMFATITDDEKRLGKDLSNFTIADISEYFHGLATASIARCLNIKAQFVKYSQYCQQKGLITDNQIHWQEVDRDFLMQCINYGKYQRQLVTREELVQVTDSLLNPSDRFVVLGLFEGICGNFYSDFRNLHMYQFEPNPKGGYLLFVGGRTLEVSELLYEYAKESADTYVVYTKEGKEKKVYAESDPYIIKQRSNSTSDSYNAFMRVISNKLSKLKKECEEPYFTQASLTNSGRIAYIHEHLNVGEDVEEYIKAHKAELIERFGYYQRLSELVEQYNELYHNN